MHPIVTHRMSARKDMNEALAMGAGRRYNSAGVASSTHPLSTPRLLASVLLSPATEASSFTP